MASRKADPQYRLIMVEPDGTELKPNTIERIMSWITLGFGLATIFMAGMVVAGWIYA